MGEIYQCLHFEKRSEPKILLQENEMLEERIKLLAKELTFLKDIFMAHAGSAHGITVDDMEIKGLLDEEEVLTQDYQLNNSLTFFFSGPDERIGILKFAFELLQIETQCARAILRQEPDLVIIFRL